METKRRRVVLTNGNVRRGRRAKLWAYGYADLAQLYRVTEGTIRNWVSEGWDASLGSIIHSLTPPPKRKVRGQVVGKEPCRPS